MSDPLNMPAWDAPNPHVMAVDVTEAHIDLMQHVNNVHYLQWLENVAWSHSTSLGMRQEDYTRLGHGMVVRRHELDYVAPALLAGLGKHKADGGCLHIKQMSDVDAKVLEKLVANTVAHVKKTHG